MIQLGPNFKLDLVRLMETRLLVQANSGGGKSFFLRKLLEETHGSVQQIVLDMEGEFGTLREKFDYILVGKNGDLDASPDTAALLARKMLELRTSVIIDLYELKQDDRILYVRNYLDSMMNAPKDLWHPTMVVLDEAHVFAPENGKCISMSAVTDLATRGRKRGYCLIPATQRLSKVHKDVAAECINKVIGRTGLDIDVKRVADELGMTSKSALALRNLDPGTFYAFGPAISKVPELVNVGAVKTKHPAPGQRTLSNKPAPTRTIADVLKKLTDLPKEAEEELRSIADFKAKIRRLELEVKSKPKTVISKKEIQEAVRHAEGKLQKQFTNDLVKLRGTVEKILQVTQRSTREEISKAFPTVKDYRIELEPITGAPMGIALTAPAVPPQLRKIEIQPNFSEDQVGKLGICEKRILAFLCQQPNRTYNKTQVAAMSGYAPNSGSFNNSLSKLRSSGFITGASQSITLSPSRAGEAMDQVSRTPGLTFTLDGWISKLGKCERAIYEHVLKNQESSFSKEELAAATGYEPTSGSFNKSLSRLRTTGLIEGSRGSSIRLNQDLQSALGN